MTSVMIRLRGSVQVSTSMGVQECIDSSFVFSRVDRIFDWQSSVGLNTKNGLCDDQDEI